MVDVANLDISMGQTNPESIMFSEFDSAEVDNLMVELRGLSKGANDSKRRSRTCGGSSRQRVVIPQMNDYRARVPTAPSTMSNFDCLDSRVVDSRESNSVMDELASLEAMAEQMLNKGNG